MKDVDIPDAPAAWTETPLYSIAAITPPDCMLTGPVGFLGRPIASPRDCVFYCVVGPGGKRIGDAAYSTREAAYKAAAALNAARPQSPA